MLAALARAEGLDGHARAVELRQAELELGYPTHMFGSNGTREAQAGGVDYATVHGAIERNLGRAVLLAGGRLSWQRQGNAGAGGRDDLAATAFAGLVAPLYTGGALEGQQSTGCIGQAVFDL